MGGRFGSMGGVSSGMSPVVILILTLIALMYGSRWVRRRLRRLKLQRENGPPRCKCGYPIERLDLPRCPECGRVFGFDATPDELGLSHDEMIRIQAARRRRQGKG